MEASEKETWFNKPRDLTLRYRDVPSRPKSGKPRVYFRPNLKTGSNWECNISYLTGIGGDSAQVGQQELKRHLGVFLVLHHVQIAFILIYHLPPGNFPREKVELLHCVPTSATFSENKVSWFSNMMLASFLHALLSFMILTCWVSPKNKDGQ